MKLSLVLNPGQISQISHQWKPQKGCIFCGVWGWVGRQESHNVQHLQLWICIMGICKMLPSFIDRYLFIFLLIGAPPSNDSRRAQNNSLSLWASQMWWLGILTHSSTFVICCANCYVVLLIPLSYLVPTFASFCTFCTSSVHWTVGRWEREDNTTCGCIFESVRTNVLSLPHPILSYSIPHNFRIFFAIYCTSLTFQSHWEIRPQYHSSI